MTDLAITQERVKVLERDFTDMKPRIESLNRFKIRVETHLVWLKWIFGTSLLGFILNAIQFIKTFKG